MQCNVCSPSPLWDMSSANNKDGGQRQAAVKIKSKMTAVFGPDDPCLQ